MASVTKLTLWSKVFRLNRTVNLCNNSKYSTATQEQGDMHFSYPLFRCKEDDPLKHNPDHEAQFYTIPHEERQTLFNLGGLPKEFQKQIETFNETCLMVRKPTLEIIDYLRKANYDDPRIKYVLYGPDGCGKSLTLAHTIHFCHRDNWIILHVPWTGTLITRIRDIVPSLSFPNKRDLPIHAAHWLQHFKLQNINKLQALDIRTSKTYSWSKREETAAGQPILDIVDHGLNRLKHSTDCVFAIFEEIRNQANEKKFKVLSVIDGVNALYNMTKLRKEHRVLLPADEITLLCAYKNHVESEYTNGALLTTVDTIASVEKRDSHLPKYLLGVEGFASLEPFVPIRIPLYNRKEISSCLDYYIDRKWIQNKRGHDADGRSELVFISGYNPYSLMRACAPL